MRDRHAQLLALSRMMKEHQRLGRFHVVKKPELAYAAIIALQIGATQKRLSDRGRSRLAGMIQDGLHANEHGLNSLLLELAVAAQLETSGWNVIHHDMEQGDPPPFDILARKNGREIEVECKFIGGDVGRNTR